VGFQLLLVAGAAGAVGVAGVAAFVIVVDVLDVGVGDRDPGLLQRRAVAERLRGGRAEAREAAVAGRVDDRFGRREGGARTPARGRRVGEVEHVADRRRDVVDVAIGFAVGVLGRRREGGRVVHNLIRRGRAEEAVEAGVAARLVGELVFAAAVSCTADRRG